MLSIHTNLASLAAQHTLVRTEGRLAAATTRLGTGFRINSAMDDAAGLQIATRLRAQTRGMAAAMANTEKSLSILQTADGALGESGDILIRMQDLAIQAADGTASAADRQALQAEFGALSNQLSNIASNTTFGGTKLLIGDTTVERAAVTATTASAAAFAASAGTALATANINHNTAIANDAAASTAATQAALASTAATAAAAAAQANLANTALAAAQTYAAAVAGATTTNGVFSTAVHFQIGAASGEAMTFSLTTQLDAMHTALHAASSTYDTFGIQSSGSGADLLLASGASAAIDKLQLALAAVADVRSTLGATANRLQHVQQNLTTMGSNAKAASGRIMDTDFAQTSADMIAGQMLLQSGGLVLRQGNSISSMLLALLS